MVEFSNLKVKGSAMSVIEDMIGGKGIARTSMKSHIVDLLE